MTTEVMAVAARWMVAFLFLASGVLKLADLPSTRALMVRYKFPVLGLALAVAVAVELGCGLLLGVGVFVSPAAGVLIAYVVAASLMIPVRQLGEPDNRKGAVLTLIKNVAITGALLQLAARPAGAGPDTVPNPPTANPSVAHRADDPAHGGRASRKTVLREDLKLKLDGKDGRVTVLELEYKPGEANANVPHRHPGPVVVYVLEGEVEMQIEGGPLKTYRKGETFFEPPGALHTVSRNPSQTEPARFLAFLLSPTDQSELTLPP
jgi:quercetin dioxygenase-like cupin family protein/uncharacterized membrane protein YphA (DoxX/SURF4 family)